MPPHGSSVLGKHILGIGFSEVGELCARFEFLEDRLEARGCAGTLNRLLRRPELNLANPYLFGAHVFLSVVFVVLRNVAFRENYFADNGMIPALLILELMSKKSAKLSELLAPLRQKYFITGEINSKIEDVPAVMERLESRYSDGRISKLDGLSVDYPDWHFNVRPSNTEPFLRLNLEALEEDKMKRLRDEVLAVIRA